MRIHQFRSTRSLRDANGVLSDRQYQCIFCDETTNMEPRYIQQMFIMNAVCPNGRKLGIIEYLIARWRGRVNCLLEFPRHVRRKQEPTVQWEDKEREDKDDED